MINPFVRPARRFLSSARAGAVTPKFTIHDLENNHCIDCYGLTDLITAIRETFHGCNYSTVFTLDSVVTHFYASPSMHKTAFPYAVGQQSYLITRNEGE